MRVLDLFSLAFDFSEVARTRGHQVCKISRVRLHPDIPLFIPQEWRKPEVLWTQIPCDTFSIASLGHHWLPGYVPKTEKCRRRIEEAKYILELIRELNPKYYFIENPVGLLRKMSFMEGIPRHTITYCQYGYTRMKPTDIWTNCSQWISRPPCKKGDPCHESAPRGSGRGTSGVRGKANKASIPLELCEEIIMACERSIKNEKNN